MGYLDLEYGDAIEIRKRLMFVFNTFMCSDSSSPGTSNPVSFPGFHPIAYVQ